MHTPSDSPGNTPGNDGPGDQTTGTVSDRIWPGMQKMQGQWPRNFNARPLWPDIIDAQLNDDTATCTLQIPPDLAWFEGHFPGQAVLPGVVQTHWACQLATAAFALEGEFSQLPKLKFITPILPTQKVTLKMKYLAAKRQISFSYISDDGDQQVLSSGSVKFIDNPSACDADS